MDNSNTPKNQTVSAPSDGTAALEKLTSSLAIAGSGKSGETRAGNSPGVRDANTVLPSAPQLPTVLPQPSVPKQSLNAHVLPSVVGTNPSNFIGRSSQSIAPSSQSIAPSSQSIAPSSQSIAPSSQSIAPSSQSIAPSSQSIAPSSQSIAPSSKSIAPSSQSIAPSSNGTNSAPLPTNQAWPPPQPVLISQPYQAYPQYSNTNNVGSYSVPTTNQLAAPPSFYNLPQYFMPSNTNMMPTPFSNASVQLSSTGLPMGVPFLAPMPYHPPPPPQLYIYAYYIPLLLQINGNSGYYAVKIGVMDRNKAGFGKRFSNTKVPWQGILRLPTATQVKNFCYSRDNYDDWAASLRFLDLENNHLLFMEPIDGADEHTIRAALLAHFGGQPLSSPVISSLLAAVQGNPFPNISNTGHTEYIALKLPDLHRIRDTFIAGSLTVISYPVQLLTPDGRAIPLKDIAVLDFNDEEESDDE